MSSNADDLTTQLAKSMFENHAGFGWSGVSESVREIYTRSANIVIAHLTSTGRLIPAGGMALTAEQVEDVWAARDGLRGYRNFTGYGRSHVNRLIAAVDALFPATEPAEDSVGDPLQAWKEFLKSKPIGWYRTMTPQFATKHFGFPGVIGSKGFRTHTTSDGGKWAWDGDDWELRCYPPAPAEPAEERRSFPTIQDVPNNTLFHTHGGDGSSLFVRNQSGDLRLCLNAGREWSKLMQEEDFLPSSGPYVEVPWSKFPQPPADPFAHPAPAEPAEDIRGLIEKSSLGTESAQALISTVSPEHGRRVAQEAARREAGTKVKLTELQRDLLQRIVDQWTKGAGWTHVFWSGTVEALISAGCIVRHEEAFNEYRPTIFGEKALAPAEPTEEETKAQTADAMQRRFIAEIRSMNPDAVMSKRLDDLEAELNASSPVVPAPTETEAGHA